MGMEGAEGTSGGAVGDEGLRTGSCRGEMALQAALASDDSRSAGGAAGCGRRELV